MTPDNNPYVGRDISWSNLYVSVNSGIFVTPSGVTGQALNGYYYYQSGSTYKILFQSFVKTDTIFGTFTPTNGTTIMVACLKA